MRIAVTDACIFIDLYDLELIAPFFSLGHEVCTSVDVFNELNPAQQQVLKAFESVGKLILHNIRMDDRMEIHSSAYPRSLSETDKTVLHLAQKLDAMVISSDKAVRNYAKKIAIEYHGVIWILDSLVEAKIVTQMEAAQKLEMLIKRNMVYQNNASLVHEMQKRLIKWRGDD